MPQFTVLVGFLLIALGVGGYFGTGSTSVTALIPAFFGLPMAVAGLVAFKPELRMHAMHGAATLGLIGLIGAGVMSIPKVFKDTSNLSTSVYMQLAMAAICLIFMIVCIRSFINARRARTI